MKTKRIYEHNFIKQVIIRVDFDSPLEYLDQGIQELLPAPWLERYPISEKRGLQEQQVTLTMQRNAQNITQSVGAPYVVWRLLPEDGTRALEVCRTYISLSMASYSRHRDSAGEFPDVVKSIVSKASGSVAFKRLGVRFVNEIELGDGDPLDWTGLIDPALRGSLGFAGRDRLLRDMSVLEIARDEMRLRTQFGMPNPDFPLPITRRLFVLDNDAYLPTRTEIDELPEALEALHHLQYEYFDRAIGDDLRMKMGMREEPCDD